MGKKTHFKISEEMKEKIKQTHLRDYGVENLGQSEEIKEKIKETCMLKYGVAIYAMSG